MSPVQAAASRAALERVAAHYDLPFSEVVAVASGQTKLDAAGVARLAEIQAPKAETPAPAPVAAPATAKSTRKKSARRRAPTKAPSIAKDMEASDREPADREPADRDGAERQAADREPADRDGAEREPADEREMEEAIAESLLEQLNAEGAGAKPEPEEVRRQEIMEEVARRRADRAAEGQKRLREKSDAIFGKFDADRDGHLCFEELRALGAATGGSLTELAFGIVCGEVEASPERGVTADQLFAMYTSAELGDASRDYNLIFPRGGAGGAGGAALGADPDAEK